MPTVEAIQAYHRCEHKGVTWVSSKILYAAVGMFAGTAGGKVNGAAAAEKVYMVLYLVFSWCGLLYDPVFFAFHMLEFFFVAQISRTLLAVVISRTRQLVMVFILLFVLTYIYAAVGWKVVVPTYRYGFGDQPDWDTGPSFMEFVLAHMNLGIRDGPQGMDDSRDVPWGFEAFSISYFIVVIVIQGAVVQGIVIDEFSVRRDMAEQMNIQKRRVDQASVPFNPFKCWLV